MPSATAGRHRLVGAGLQRGGVVLQPGQPAGPVHPDPAQEPDLDDGGPDVGRQPRPGGQHQQHRRRPGVQHRGHDHDRADVAGAEHRPGQARARPPSPSGPGPAARTTAPRRRGGRRPGRSPMPVTRTSLPGGAVVAVWYRWRASRLDWAPRSWAAALDRRPPGRGQDRRQGEQGQSGQPRADRDQQPDGHAQPQHPAGGGEQRHVQVVEHEHLLAQHRQAVQPLGPLLVGDGRHRRLEPGHVRLQGDRDPVAEAALDPRVDRPQDPGGRRRQPQADRGHQQQPPVALQHPLAEQGQPQGQQGVGQRGRQRQQEGRRPAARGSWR